MTDAELDELDKKIEKRKEEMKETYNKFWSEFGKSIKAGIVEDVSNRKALSEISRFYSTYKEGKELISFDDYIERKKEKQEEIYYLGGDSKDKMMKSPVVKGLIRKKYEILLLDDAIDEYTIFTLDKYKDLKFVNIGKTGFKMPFEENEEEQLRKLEKYYQPLTTWFQELLKEEVENISIGMHS